MISTRTSIFELLITNQLAFFMESKIFNFVFMQFERYISDLLYRYECVIIPEFGAFLTQNVSAQIHDSTHAMYPPKKVLSFNEQLTSNDGLLANYISNVEKIPFENANKKIAKKVKRLKSYLTAGETLSFANIGTIILNAQGNIAFEPSNEVNFRADAFGLSQFIAPAVQREVYKEEVEVLEEKTPIAITPEKRERVPYLRYAAVTLLVLTFGGLVTSGIYFNNIKTQNALVEQQAQEKIDHKIQEATFIIENPLPEITLSLEKHIGNYHIVGGAFRVEANCDKKLNQLRDLGYKARKIGKNKYGLHQVVYASYNNRLDAQKALFEIRRQNNKDAWLLIKNLNK